MANGRWALAAVLLATAALATACGLGVQTMALALRPAVGVSGSAPVVVRVPTYGGAGRAAPGAITGWPLPSGQRARSAPVTLMAPAAETLVAAWDRRAFASLGFHLARAPSARDGGWWEFARGGHLLVGVHLKPIGGGETQVTYVGLQTAPQARAG